MPRVPLDFFSSFVVLFFKKRGVGQAMRLLTFLSFQPNDELRGTL